MGVPYEVKPVGGVRVRGGETVTVKLDCPPRCFIHKLIVVQTDGAVDNFTVELFNHRNAQEGEAGSASASDAGGHPIPLDFYRVGSPKSGSGGSLLYFSDEATGGAGLPFVCQDPPESGKQGRSPRNLYVRISPTGGGDKEFMIGVGVDQVLGDG